MSIDITSPGEKTYIVIGAPYSATSFIAKLLNDWGVKMNPSDEKYYEDKDFVKVNKKIARKGIDCTEEIKELVKKKKDKFWGFKDPRASVTLDKILPHLEGDVYLICCFRKPREVKQSWRRNRLSSDISKRRLDRYNRSIIKIIKQFCEL